MTRRFPALATVLALAMPLVGFVWGQSGHRVVAEIAQRHLSPQADWRIRELLDGQSLAQISTWPDEIRSDTSWSCQAPFHYVTLRPGTNYFENWAGGGDAVRGVVYFADVLRDPQATRSDRQQALRFLTHLAGDLHQPLHIGRGCDLGGNRVDVSWFGQGTNLHSVWDVKLLESENLSFTELTRFLDQPTREQIASFRTSNPLDWAYDSQRHLESVYTCYTGSNGGDRCPCFCGDCTGGRSVFGGCRTTQCALAISDDIQLGYQYTFRNMPIIREQLLKGGVRLAQMLNWIFADSLAPPDEFRAVRDSIAAVPGWDTAFRTCTANR